MLKPEISSRTFRISAQNRKKCILRQVIAISFRDFDILRVKISKFAEKQNGETCNKPTEEGVAAALLQTEAVIEHEVLLPLAGHAEAQIKVSNGNDCCEATTALVPVEERCGSSRTKRRNQLRRSRRKSVAIDRCSLLMLRPQCEVRAANCADFPSFHERVSNLETLVLHRLPAAVPKCGQSAASCPLGVSAWQLEREIAGASKLQCWWRCRRSLSGNRKYGEEASQRPANLDDDMLSHRELEAEDIVELHRIGGGLPFECPKLAFVVRDELANVQAVTTSCCRNIDVYVNKLHNWSSTGRWGALSKAVSEEGESEEEKTSESEVEWSESDSA